MGVAAIVWAICGMGITFAQQKPQSLSRPQAKITVKITSEDGKPISDAEVGIGFMIGNPPGQGPGTRTLEQRGLSKSDGTFTAQDQCGGGAGLGVSKDGFYRTYGPRIVFKEVEGGKWQPWNPTVELILKPILNPIPMYARKVQRLRIPVVGQPVGFDLMTSDWVAPYGKGSVSDLTFMLQKTFVDVEKPFDATLMITFANEGDGIQPTAAAPHVGSELRLPRHAPEDGYEFKLIKTTSRAAANQMIVPASKDDLNYFFRVRTQKEDGKIVSTNYGKIDRDIGFDIINSDTALLFFTYYLNPTPNDRNMEFDPARNLFGELPNQEKVTAP